MEAERAREFTVYKKSRLDRTIPQFAKNLISFSYLRRETPSPNLP